jgi:hypothetical protein
MKFCSIAYIFRSIWIKFDTENVEKRCTGQYEFREHRRSENSYFTTGVDKFPSTLCTLINGFS